MESSSPSSSPSSSLVSAPAPAPFTLPRKVFVFNGSMNDDMDDFIELIKEFLQLNVGNNRPLLIRATSSGGIPEQIFSLCGLLRQVQAEGHEVTVHVLGQLCNFTYAVAAAATRIVIEPTASFVFSQSFLELGGMLSSIDNDLDYQDTLFDKLVKAICQRSGGKVDEATVRSWQPKMITAQEALELGLVDEVMPMPQAQLKANHLPEQSIRFNGAFTSGEVFDKAVFLNNWLEDPSNAGRPLRLFLTSVGGTVVQALSLFGMFCEAQRQGHHLTIHVIGQAYSCAMWFPVCALHSGTVLIDGQATLMFHQPSREKVSGSPDEIRAKLAVDKALFAQTCALLRSTSGINQELIDSWANRHDLYFSADVAVQLGLGQLV